MRSFRSRNPVPIGAAFVVLTLLAMYLSFNVGKISFVSGPTYHAAFSEAAGLRAGDKVRVGGVAVGQHLIAATDPGRGRNRGRFRDANEIETELTHADLTVASR